MNELQHRTFPEVPALRKIKRRGSLLGMRQLFHYERKGQPLASASTFQSRLFRNGMWALGVVTGSLAIGTAGYMYFDGMVFIDAFLNASMILSGMGPIGELKHDGAKIFAALYAIASGLLLFAVAGIILLPVYHRILHRFHMQVEDAPDDATPPKPAPKKRKR